MSEQREMTLNEWMKRLPEFHLANKQLTDERKQATDRIEQLERENEEQSHLIETQRRAIDGLGCQITNHYESNQKLDKENSTLRSKANAYDTIISHLEKKTIYQEAKQECFKDQVFGGSTIVLVAFEKAYDGYLANL